MKTLIIRVKGMHCRSCEMLLEESLKAVPGVLNASASAASGKVCVKFDDSKANKDSLNSIVMQEGYEVA